MLRGRALDELALRAVLAGRPASRASGPPRRGAPARERVVYDPVALAIVVESIERLLWSRVAKFIRRVPALYDQAEDLVSTLKLDLVSAWLPLYDGRNALTTYVGACSDYRLRSYALRTPRGPVRVPLHVLENPAARERPEVQAALRPALDVYGGTTEAGDLHSDPLAPGPSVVELAARRERADRVAALLDRLRPREREVLCRRFGLGCEPETLEEIARRFGRSRERVRQIEKMALEQLRRWAGAA